jgi:hypothetical protein
VFGDDDRYLRRVVQRIEHLEIALSWNTEQTIHTVDAERIDKDAPAGASPVGFRHQAISCEV